MIYFPWINDLSLPSKFIYFGFVLQEGTSNYFKGLMLILCYLIVAASFFVHVDPKSKFDQTLRCFNLKDISVLNDV